MAQTAAYSLLPTSSPNSSEGPNYPFEHEETWSSERPTNHSRGPQSFSRFWLTSRPARLSRAATRPNTVAVVAASALFILALLITFSDHPWVPQLMEEKSFGLRDCFELPADELEWQTTQLPAEQSLQCPFDPEPFLVLDEATPDEKQHKQSMDIQWSGECLEAMLGGGQIQPGSCRNARSRLEAQNIDLVWTWVNGSSPLLELTRRDRAAEISGAASEAETMDGVAAKLFRDHDELRHSVRAALQHFNEANDFFLIGSDLPVSVHGVDDDATTMEARVGQLPAWLALEEIGVDGAFTDWGRTGKQTRFQVNQHRDIFSHYEGTVFNSLAIESQFSNLGNIGVSDIFVYINDDVFFSRDLGASDFHMAEHGIVMRMQNYITISPNPDIPQHDGLEWESLQYSNFLLSNRFGSRLRPYPAHLAKTLSLPMLREVAAAWPDEISLVASRPFRGMKHAQEPATTADAYMVFMEHHWIVERWRELLLWSWVVARGRDRATGQGESNPDAWTTEIAQAAWRELGGGTQEAVLEVRRAHRSTLDDVRERTRAKATTLVFSSLDGYPYSEEMGERGWVSEGAVCEIDFERCFSSHDSASRTFQRIAFEEPTACGDCIIRALVNKSGERGLGAFLPAASRDLASGVPQNVPVLPTTGSWQNTDFKLANVLESTNLEEINIRDMVLRMLQRYRFVLGDTPFMFAIVTDPHSAEQYVQAIESDKSLAIVCVNDNVAESDDQVREILGEWMDQRWNQSAGWERGQRRKKTKGMS